MKITNGSNILILRKSGTFIEIPDGKDIRKDIPLDAEYAFINISLNELPTYVMIPIDNLITRIYKCSVDFRMSLCDMELIYGWGLNELGVPISNIHHFEIETVSQLYNFLNSFDGIISITEFSSDMYNSMNELTFDIFKFKLKSDRYTFEFNLQDKFEKIIDEYSVITIGIIEYIGKMMNANCNTADIEHESSTSFILNPKKKTYNTITNKALKSELSDIKDKHVILCKAFEGYLGSVYNSINKYEYVVLHEVQDIEVQIVPNIVGLRYSNNSLSGEIDGDIWCNMDYESELEYLKDKLEIEDRPFLNLQCGGYSGTITIFYQMLTIIKMVLSIHYCYTGGDPDIKYEFTMEDCILLEQMAPHLAYIKYTLSNGNEVIDRAVIDYEDYRLSYRHIFSKIYKAILKIGREC